MSKSWSIDLDAPIVPGQSAAGIFLGDDIHKALDYEVPILIERRLDLVLYDFGPVRVWARDDIVSQVGIRSGYRGRLLDQVQVGCRIVDIEKALDCKIEEDDEDNLVVPGLPGLCFESEQWKGNRTIAENKQAQVVEIFVFRSVRSASRFWTHVTRH